MIAPYYQHAGITIYCGDCRDILPTLDGFDLLLTDPPYGLGESAKKNAGRGTSSAKWKRVKPRDYGDFDWDRLIDAETIQLCRDKARKQIIWGGNYYDLPPCKGPLVWDKMNSGDFADGEMAWNNLGTALRIKRHLWNGFRRAGNEERFHPTQKPLAVMAWALDLAGDDVETVVDPFMGSGTTLRAAKDVGKRAVGIDLSERYCEIAVRRLEQEVLPLYT